MEWNNRLLRRSRWIEQMIIGLAVLLMVASGVGLVFFLNR